jgi:hypothetical protein
MPEPSPPETDVVPRPAPIPKARSDRPAFVAFNRALLDLVDGNGSIYENLSIITRMTVDSMKSRVKRARWSYPEDERPAPRLDHEEAAYLTKAYGRTDDPAVREFLRSIRAPKRSRPDGRSGRDRAEKALPDRRPMKSR